MRVLIVEDELHLAAAVQEGLRPAAVPADTVHDGETALQHLAATGYDIVLLERDTPVIHGEVLCPLIPLYG
ncbi:hypothetical protein [Kitasatospora sp. NPDC057223]|uniref:hypothetical protein n=1 Tax=Kitasatospora sp. NPDC057223 TaxID=3346055 RepID=UPI00362F010A